MNRWVYSDNIASEIGQSFKEIQTPNFADTLVIFQFSSCLLAKSMKIVREFLKKDAQQTFTCLNSTLKTLKKVWNMMKIN